MPRHKQVTTCRKSGGPVSKHCSCEHCCLAVCSVCGAGEGSLTTDCPGVQMSADKQQEVFETNYDYTDDRGWHLAQNDDGSPIRRSAHFEDTTLPPEPSRVDVRAIIAPTIDWSRVDRTMDFQHKLIQKEIAWVLADRTCEDRSAALARIEDECGPLRGKTDLDAAERDLLGKLEQEKIAFQIACRNVERCNDERNQLARRLVDMLEEGSSSTASYGLKNLARQHGID